MGKKSQPAAPPPPNPYEIADADARYNRIDQYTPYGNLTYSGANRNVANLNLSPEVQNLFDSQLQLDQGFLNRGLQAQSQLPTSQPFAGFGIPGQEGFSQGIPGLTSITGQNVLPNVPTLSGINAPQLSAPNLQTSVNAPNLQGGINAPNLQGQIQGLDFSNLSSLPQDYNAYRSDAERAFFDRSAGLLNEQFGRQEDQLRQTLANQGIDVTSGAGAQEFGNFNQRRGETFSNLARDATLFGGQEASRALADQLGLRQQGVGEALNQFGAGLQQGQFGNNAALQGLEGQLAAQGFNNNVGLDQLNANLAAGQFGNNALLQGFGIDQALRDNSIQGQLLNNEVMGQNFGLQNQGFQNLMQQGSFNNTARSQLLNETLAARGNQFNELASLLGLQQVQQPGLNNFFTPGQVNTGNAFALQQAGLQNNFNTQSQMAANRKGAGAELAGTLGGAFLGGPFGAAIGGRIGGSLV